MSTGMNDQNKCGHCGGYHAGQCPSVAAFEYHPNGTIKRVEYHATPQPVDLAENIKIGQTVSATPSHIMDAAANTWEPEEHARLAALLRAAAVGHPHAKIAWPHRLLHDAADALEAKSKSK